MCAINFRILLSTLMVRNCIPTTGLTLFYTGRTHRTLHTLYVWNQLVWSWRLINDKRRLSKHQERGLKSINAHLFYSEIQLFLTMQILWCILFNRFEHFRKCFCISVFWIKIIIDLNNKFSLKGTCILKRRRKLFNHLVENRYGWAFIKSYACINRVLNKMVRNVC